MYGNFAEVYDRLMDDVDYKAWADYLENIFKYKQVRVKNILELACGTGNLTIELTKRAFDIAGIDLSAEMLEQARLKSINEGIDLVLLNQDMTDLDFDIYNLDCVLCACDGYNYILDESALVRSFKSVYEKLKEKGIFIFDISSNYKIANILGDNTFVDNSDDISYIWTNYYDPEDKICEMDLSFFLQDKDKSNQYRRFDEFHTQRAYSSEEMISYLREAGFEDVEVLSDFTFSAETNHSERLFFICIKH